MEVLGGKRVRDKNGRLPGEVGEAGGVLVYRNSLYFLLDFAVNLKLLCKIAYF